MELWKGVWVHLERKRGNSSHTRDSLVRLDVLLQVILASEALATDGAGERPQSRVDALVTRQLLVPRERLATVGLITGKGSLSCGELVSALCALHSDSRATNLCGCAHGLEAVRCWRKRPDSEGTGSAWVAASSDAASRSESS